jgi:Phage tail-collar fibre protein
VTEAETIRWEARGTVFKFRAADIEAAGLHEPTLDEMVALGLVPYEVRDAGHNLLCNAGINRLESLLIAGGGQAYDNTHTAIGVGDGGGSVPTAAATDTDLAAVVNAANRYFQVADATYPSQASQVVTIQATFATGNGNFEWREWGVAQNTASGANAATAPLLNHKGVDLGLKTSAAAWAFKITITIS